MKKETKLLIALICSLVILFIGAYLYGLSKAMPTLEVLAKAFLIVGGVGGVFTFVYWLNYLDLN